MCNCGSYTLNTGMPSSMNIVFLLVFLLKKENNKCCEVTTNICRMRTVCSGKGGVSMHAIIQTAAMNVFLLDWNVKYPSLIALSERTIVSIKKFSVEMRGMLVTRGSMNSVTSGLPFGGIHSSPPLPSRLVYLSLIHIQMCIRNRADTYSMERWANVSELKNFTLIIGTVYC